MKYVLLFLAAFFLLSCDSGYKKVTVVKMALISTPDNLLDTTSCRQLWGDIQRYGLDMDEAREDWNQVILNSAYRLIEEGCVKRTAQ